MTKITVISASGLKNLELAKKFEEQLVALGAEVSLLNLMSLDLPLYTSESDAKNDAKALLGPWFDTLHTSNGYVFLAPEYNGGIPPIFTNFLAWVSRSSKDWRECFNGKTGIIGTFSGGGSGNILIALRMQLSFIGMNILGRQVLTHAAKPLDDQFVQLICKQLLAQSAK
jgi:chromate reductase